jgi:peptidoglycan/xylan/chitin deacetylase (PgdA/CDA1 family)
MLNLRNTTIALAGVIALLAWWHAPWYGYVLAVAGYTLPLAWGSYHIGSNFYIDVITKGPGGATGARAIALTFDDGPANQYTPEILDILKEKDAPAAFFCIGKNIPGRENLLRRIHDEGHLVGNHSYSHHFWFDLFSTRHMRADLRQMDAAVRAVTGLTPRLFRPPYGVTNPNLAKAIRKEGYTPIGWNVRSLDTVINDPVKLRKRIEKALRPGSIVLLHDTIDATLVMLPQLIDGARAAGYAITRLDKMCNIAPYA